MMKNEPHQLCNEKTAVLKARLKSLKTLAVAFSAGVDSAFLLVMAVRSGLERLLAVTVDSVFVTREEIQRARQTAKVLGVTHQVIPVDILAYGKVAKNSPERCYHCKNVVFSLIRDAADQAGIAHVAHGVNTDDLGDVRPGLKAAREMEICAPLLDAGFSKQEIRNCSKQMGLDTWNLPAQSCLATRIPFSDPITRTALERVEQAESFLKSLEFVHVRVRSHGRLACIETGAGEIDALMAVRHKILPVLKSLGFNFVSVDLDGYRVGRMNLL